MNRVEEQLHQSKNRLKDLEQQSLEIEQELESTTKRHITDRLTKGIVSKIALFQMFKKIGH